MQESLLEIDEEEDTTTTDFCKPFFAEAAEESSEHAAAGFPDPNISFAKVTSSNHDHMPWTFEQLLLDRLHSHNKHLRLICVDGGVQIDPVIIMPFLGSLPPHFRPQFLMNIGL